MIKWSGALLALVVLRAGVAGAYEDTEAVAFSADGKLLAVAGAETVDAAEKHTRYSVEKPVLHIWDVASGKLVRSIAPDSKGFPGFWTRVAFSPDGKRVLAAGLAWDVATGKLHRELKGVIYSPNGKWIAGGDASGGGSGGDLWLRNAATGALLFNKDVRVDRPETIVFSPDSSKLALMSDTHLFIFNVPSGEQDAALDNQGGTPLLWSDDGSHLVACCVTLIDAESGRQLARETVADDTATDADGRATPAMVLTHDGKWLGVGGKLGLTWVTLPKLETKYEWKGAIANISALAVSPDGKLVAVGHPDRGEIQLIDPAKNSLSVLKTLTAPRAAKLGTEADPMGKSDGDKSEPAKPEVKPEVKAPEKAAPKALTDDQKQAADAVEQAASNAAVWLGKIKHPEDWKEELAKPSFMKLAKDQGDDCEKAIAAARKLGVPEDHPVDFNVYQSGVDKPQPLSAIDSLLCRPLMGKAGAIVDQQAGAEAARYAPFLKVLSGDKAKIFSEQHIPDMNDCAGARCSGMYGHKGKRLETPADFKGSDVWYYFVHVQDAAVPTWEVEGWVFSGMKKTKSYDKTGKGDLPPASAFK